MPASNHDNDPSWVGFLKATIAGGLLFLLPLILVVLLFSHAMRDCRKGGAPDFGIPDARQSCRSGGRRRSCGADADLNFSRGWASRAHHAGAQSHALVREFISRRFTAIPTGQERGRGARPDRERRGSQTGPRQYRGRMADWTTCLRHCRRVGLRFFFRRPRHQCRAM